MSATGGFDCKSVPPNTRKNLEFFQNTGNQGSETADNQYISIKGDCSMLSTVELRESIIRLLEQIERTTGQKPQPDARRASFRYAWPVQATIELVDADDSSEPLFVTVGHISRDGSDFRSSRELEPDEKVLVTLETDQGQLQIPATVVHSTQSIVKFVIGVKFNLEDSGQADQSDDQTDDQ